MGRWVSLMRVALLLTLAACLSACGSNNPVTSSTTYTTPTKVSLSPSPATSLEVGGIASFSATATNASNTGLNEAFAYESSNTSVLTISTSGQVCAGSWDSLTNPTVCKPGPVGVAQVTAVALGVSSPATTVYVHQHVDSIALSPIPGQPPPLSASCFSKGQTYNYQATAYSRQGGPAPGLDITSSVGPFFWQAVNSNVVTIVAATTANQVSGLQPGQAKMTANIPGTTPIVASLGGVSSVPIPFNTCAVQSIVLAPTNGGGNTVSVARSASTAITATVLDTQGNTITGSFLTWCSSDPASVSTGTNNCGLGSTSFSATSTAAGGGASIIATCTPPNCNINLFPTLPIYPPSPITVFATGGTAAASATTTAWVTTTGCKGTDGCVSELAPITTTITSGSSKSTVGTLINLPATPNSLIFNRGGTTAYLGTDTGQLGTRGVMVLNASAKSVSEYPAVVGKVLAVSPDGGTAIVSDTLGTPSQVYLFTCNSASSSSSSGCGSASNATLNIAGATAAAFSPDGLKAFIVAGSNLYVYSRLDALKTIPLAAPVNDVSFLANGAFAYLAGGDPSGVTVRRTCDNAIAQPTIATPGVPFFLRALPDGIHVLGVDSPGVNILTASNMSTEGCTPAISNSASFVNLGQGNFVPNQLIVSTDGSTAYLLTQSSGSILIFNIAAQTTSAIQLNGNVLPLQASLSPDGKSLYVGASDGMVHLLDTQGGADIQQISFLTQPANLQAGLCGNVNFPTQSVVSITAAAQSGATTTYSYTLTSGPALQVGRRITITGMANPGDNGAFTITAVGNGTFTVGNAIGVTTGGQNGTGTVVFACNPDLVAVAP